MASHLLPAAASVRALWPADPLGRLFRVALGLFIGTILFSLAGMLLLKWVPAAMGVFGPYLMGLIRTPTWIYMALLPVLPVLMYAKALGWKRMVFFVLWGSLVGLSFELIGTVGLVEVGGVALPFGHYAYTGMLGPKILGHVPWFIPPSWFALSILSLDLARRVASRRTGRILLGTLFMVLWDVALDPAMSTGTALSPVFWFYPDGGFFYGMPLTNWMGWTFVTLIIMAGYEFIGGGLHTSSPWALLVYVLNGAFPLLVALIMGLHGAFVAGTLAIATPLLVVYFAGGPVCDRVLGDSRRAANADT